MSGKEFSLGLLCVPSVKKLSVNVYISFPFGFEGSDCISSSLLSFILFYIVN